jgi:hypothetical protein
MKFNKNITNTKIEIIKFNTICLCHNNKLKERGFFLYINSKYVDGCLKLTKPRG